MPPEAEPMREKLQADLKVAMKSRQTERTSTLRMLISQIRYAEIAKKSDLSDDEVIALIRKAVRERNDAAVLYRKGGRSELEEQEKREAQILNAYLPELLSGPELEKIIETRLRKLEFTEKRQMGQARTAIMEELRGRVDGAEASRIVASLLR